MPTLNLTGQLPAWLASNAYRLILENLKVALRDAGLDNIAATIRPSTEKDILKRKHLPAHSLSLQAGYPTNPHTLAIVGTGASPRNDIVSLLVSMPKEAVVLFREFFKAYRTGIYTRTSSPDLTVEAAPDSPETTQIDDDTFALYLDALRDLGGTVTLGTARVAALKSTNSKHLLNACIAAGFLLNNNGICSISDKGQDLLARLVDPPEEAPPPVIKAAPSEFETLRAAVQAARQQHAAVDAEHQKSQPLRLELDRQLSTARAGLHTAAQNVTLLQERLAKAEEQHTLCRREVLRLEGQERTLPDLAAAHARAKETLTQAEKAYQAYVQL